MAKKHLFVSSQLIKKFPALNKASWLFEAFVMRALIGLIRVLPIRSAATMTHWVFRTTAPVLPFAKKISENMHVAFPEKNAHEIAQLTRQASGNLGLAAVDLILSDRIWAEREQRLELVVEEGADLSNYRDRPVVLASGHIGAWQIGGFVGELTGIDFTTLYAPEENPYLRDYFFHLRNSLPCGFVSRDGGMRALTRILRQGRAVGMICDTRKGSAESLMFFGRETPANTGAARLALRHKASLFPVRTQRLPGMKFRITVFKAVEPDDLDAPVTEQASQMTQKLFNHFEAWIREEPDQWMCFGRRWPHDVYELESELTEKTAGA